MTQHAIAHLDFIEDKLGMIAFKSVTFLSYLVSKAAFSAHSDAATESDEEWLAPFRAAHDEINKIFNQVRPLLGADDDDIDNYHIENFLYQQALCQVIMSEYELAKKTLLIP